MTFSVGQGERKADTHKVLLFPTRRKAFNS